jgi:hypothetical protein
MIFQDDEDRERRKAEQAGIFKHVQSRRVPAPAPGEDTRPAWPWCAFGDLQADEDSHHADDASVDWFDLNYDLPGDAVSLVEFRTVTGKVGYSGDVLEFAADLKKACPADYLRLRLWLIAEAMDPRSPGVLN